MWTSVSNDDVSKEIAGAKRRRSVRDAPTGCGSDYNPILWITVLAGDRRRMT